MIKRSSIKRILRRDHIEFKKARKKYRKFINILFEKWIDNVIDMYEKEKRITAIRGESPLITALKTIKKRGVR